jgi:hypothetical protein
VCHFLSFLDFHEFTQKAKYSTTGKLGYFSLMLYAAALLSLLASPSAALWRHRTTKNPVQPEVMVGKAEFTDMNAQQMFLQTMKTPREGDKLNMASRIRASFHSIDANFGRVPAKNDVVVSISYREACIWCYNFERYLSPVRKNLRIM